MAARNLSDKKTDLKDLQEDMVTLAVISIVIPNYNEKITSGKTYLSIYEESGS